MDFKEIKFEDDLDELDAGDLRTLVTEYQKAQHANKEEFEEVTETVSEFEDYSTEVTEEVAELSDLPAEEVEAMSFSARRDLLETLQDTEDDTQEGEFADRGSRGETHPDGEAGGVDDAVAESFRSISGVTIND